MCGVWCGVSLADFLFYNRNLVKKFGPFLSVKYKPKFLVRLELPYIPKLEVTGLAGGFSEQRDFRQDVCWIATAVSSLKIVSSLFSSLFSFQGS